MNNYCTKCGKELEKDELVCKNCNTPIVELPYNYEYKSPEKRKKTRKILIIVGICLLSVFFFCFGKAAINEIKINKLKKEYVESYIKENYGNLNYSIKYESSGKCIISGDCYVDYVGGCESGGCQEYEYLDENDCKSYYFDVKNNTNQFIITVVDRNNVISVVEGRNIYGTDKENNELSYNSSIYDNSSK